MTILGGSNVSGERIPGGSGNKEESGTRVGVRPGRLGHWRCANRDAFRSVAEGNTPYNLACRRSRTAAWDADSCVQPQYTHTSLIRALRDRTLPVTSRVPVTPNHIHLDGEKAIDMAYDVNISTKSDKRVVIFPLKLAQIVPGRPKCP